ncbi:hypothetical protein BDP81DRAFT_414578 [Colletotrichum phormii]|uniref:Uncharacterized protein n=1 Tax=Colletotrichum phormii TaxID=359342 RepID=A0AAJ0A4G6_9PEZI|nr:uncharacterized protein BDP81DRAFT_414578 [Colletotrichum phormii]KAK1656308.1 hypothetical protein BDP81DRAFT_414578 [Colletotrichum phormii]
MNIIKRRGDADDGGYGWLGGRLLQLGAPQPGFVAASWAVSMAFGTSCFMPLPIHWTFITRVHGFPTGLGFNGAILFLLISISPFRPRYNRSITKFPTKKDGTDGHRCSAYLPLYGVHSNKYRGMGSLETLAMTNAGVMFLG